MNQTTKQIKSFTTAKPNGTMAAKLVSFSTLKSMKKEPISYSGVSTKSTNNTLTSIRSNGPNLAKNLVLLSDDSSTLIDGTESDFTEKITSEQVK